MAKKPKEESGAHTLSSLQTAMNSEMGAGTMFRGTGLAKDPPRLPTGIFAIDFSTGGGLPLWATSCFWGPECLAGDSFIQYSTRTDTVRHDNKGGTIRRLYERFHGVSGKGKGNYQRKESVDALFTVPSVNESNRIFHNKVLDVVSCGVKRCYSVVLKSGLQIETTAQHRFYCKGAKFVKLAELQSGDLVYVHNGTPYRVTDPEIRRRPEVLVKHHSSWPKKVVAKKYVYYRGRVSHAVYEARMNTMQYDEYIAVLNTNSMVEVRKLWSVPVGMHVHHKDLNSENNDYDNLELLVGKEHNRNHAELQHNNLRYVAVLDEIISIKCVGDKETFDLKCEYPHNNYVANGFVVHNSGGKTTAAINALSMAHSICWRCFKLIEYCECSAKPVEMGAMWQDVEGCIAEDQEMFDPVSGFVGSLGEYVKQKRASVVSLEDGKLCVSEPSMLYDSGICETLRIKTATAELRATLDHPVFTYRGGAGMWVEMQEIAVGDYIARPRHSISVEPVDSEFTADMAELLGLLIGDGSMTDSNRSVSFAGIDSEVWARLEKLVMPFGYCVKRQDDRHGRIVQSDAHGKKHEKGSGAFLQMFLRKIGLWNKRSGEKFIPAPLLMESTEKIGRLLSGLWMTDGGVNPARLSLAYSTTSRTLAVHVRWLLQRIGILPRMSKVVYHNDKHADAYIVTVNGYDNLRKFMAAVPLYSYKRDMLSELLHKQRKQIHMTADCYLPCYSNRENCSQRALIVNDTEIWWDKVVCIENAGECRCYDATVPVGSSWTANDVIVHNTLDRDWATAVGADPNKYMVTLADSAEQYIDIAEKAVVADDCGLLVVDSLAGLVPQAEIDASALDQFMGLQARMITRMVRNMKQCLISERKRGKPVTVLFTNQLRKKIGVMFGDPETMSGGHGMFHEFSLLIRCSKKAFDESGKKKFTDKSRNVIKAQRHTFTVKKAKVLTLAGAGEYTRVKEPMPDVRLQKGQIDDFNTVMNYAKNYDVVWPDGKAWEFLGMKFKRQQDIMELWRQERTEFLRAKMEIIHRAKLEISGEAPVKT